MGNIQYTLKSRTRKGCLIMSIDALLEEEYVYYCGFFAYISSIKAWKLEHVVKAIETGAFRYAFPAKTDKIRFSDEDVLYAENRLGLEHTIENRAEIIRILHDYDRGYGDVDDVIDLYEDDPGY